MDWSDIGTWPNSEFSRRSPGPVHQWHVQETGEGPTMILLHGAGGSTHSFRTLMPLLAQDFHVVALDLPGQGFTRIGPRHRCGLVAMAEDIEKLIRQEGWHPAAIVGHSAGAAVALEISRRIKTPDGATPMVIGINAALGRFEGLAGVLFPIMAKLLSAVPFTASLFASASASPARVKALIDSTGSRIDAEGLELYRRLVGDTTHVDGTLRMMAQWSLNPLLDALPELDTPVVFIVGDNDRTVPPRISEEAAARMPDARVIHIPDTGHLVHEEKPDQVAQLIRDALAPRKS